MLLFLFSESIAVILTQLGAKRSVLTGLNYPELRSVSTRMNLITAK